MTSEIPFEKALQKYPFLIQGGFYAKQLKRYFEHFKREQILILSFDRIKQNPEEELKKILGFLGADTKIAAEILKVHDGQTVEIVW